MKFTAIGRWGTPALLLTSSVLAIGLIAAQQSSTLVISGQQGQANVIQVQGKNYVEVDGLARLTNSSISFNGNQIVLALPGSGGNVPAAAPASAPGFSKAFVTAGMEAMAQVREWHTALQTAIERGVPINNEWLGAYRAQAQTSVRLASVAISTDADKNVYPFLVNQYNNMKSLDDEYLQMTKSMTYIDPNALQSDPINQKFVACRRSLSQMANSNQFMDDGSCQ
jgi:hypothetical protein